ncbi:MAG: hypothetical protein K2O91_10765, partial [Lachnospiraceae bacterium]|nr:hypothetical protein [Lachnospiraceae bacterium]
LNIYAYRGYFGIFCILTYLRCITKISCEVVFIVFSHVKERGNKDMGNKIDMVYKGINILKNLPKPATEYFNSSRFFYVYFKE